MNDDSTELLSLPALAKALNLPKRWIKAEADAARIPHLRIGKRYRFSREAVVRTLADRAACGSAKLSQVAGRRTKSDADRQQLGSG